MEKKTKYQKLAEKILMKKESAWLMLRKNEEKKVFSFAESYKDFLNKSKTELEAVETIRKIAESYGFKEYPKSKVKYYLINRGKNIALVKKGESIEKGVNIAISHLDSPRLDLKPHPLYEDSDIALFKTHYYGGIKKYHWVSSQLALHGIVIRKDGKKIHVKIGDSKKDPVFTIADLLPHLDKKQEEKPMKEAIEAEQLNIIVGNMPVNDKKIDEKIKLNIMKILNEKYGITEEDFVTAELHAVPVAEARDLGFDKSMVISYGQDDKSSTYAALLAFLEAKAKKTLIFLGVDKEEIGSEGPTGMKSSFIEEVIRTLTKQDPRLLLSRSKVLSCDVDAAVNPTFKDVHDTLNANYLGRGPVVAMYTGYGGKYSASDAGAEYTYKLISILRKHKIPWQSGELGKVDEGGGGTIAKYVAKYNCDVIDFGPPVLGMHGPMEVASKIDVYYTYKGIKAFYEEME
ncbi:aminopeptidase [Candidatus Micrarchaeota archaeon]|nr:MAG: aminopeptidase [Candidatus Micrarchaeota archaeon]